MVLHAALLLLSAGPAQPLVPRLWAGLTPGGYQAGFSVRIERDPARRLDGTDRPVQVACWFPATSGSGTPQKFRDYFVASASERQPATAAAERTAIEREQASFAEAGVARGVVDRWLGEPVYAHAGASAAAGVHPLVLVAQGNGQSAGDQAILSEFLASHGFVVCTTPSQARLGDRMTGEADVLPSAEAQAADLAIAERSARARFRTRADAAALVAHSFGARSALLYAARHGAGALVSLDGGIGAAEARTWIDGAAIDRAHFTTPILHIYEEGDRAITPDLGLIRSLTAADRMVVKVDGLRHIDFTSLGFGSSAIEGLTGTAPPNLSRKCSRIAALTELFLEAHVNHSSTAAASLRQAALDTWMTAEHLRARH